MGLARMPAHSVWHGHQGGGGGSEGPWVVRMWSYPTVGVGSRMGLFPEPPTLSSDALTRFPEDRPRELLSLVASLLGAPARAPSSSTQAPYSSSRSSKSGPASALHECKRERRRAMSERAQEGVGGGGGRTSGQLYRGGCPWAIRLPFCLSTSIPEQSHGSWSRSGGRKERATGKALTRARCSEKRCL